LINREFQSLFLNLPRFSKTRFAPSPTGNLHLGHVAHGLFVWLTAKLLGGEVLVRIEDHDQTRCKAIFKDQIFEDLGFLGLVPDPSLLHKKASIQSEHPERYEKFLRSLPTYLCDCSRKVIEERVNPTGPETAYDGYCRYRNLEEGAERIRWDPQSITFLDYRLGSFTQNPEKQCGDIVLRDRNKNFTYQYSVVVDDFVEEIDFIIRGEDLLDSTVRQLRLHEELGNPKLPKFFHHPLILGDSGVKLSKRDSSESIKDLAKKGLSSEEIIGRAAFLTGLWQKDEPISFEQLLYWYGNS
jgi:glutamyl-tRNA synthetase/glutamyl-Q tRNA(Asp) synthetase